ncbi:MAG: DUF4411 family protein [Patescibacteria group bacterium]|nr:DUF4411 family protein [Patescibacteria group bacterium]MDD4303915.1 DUF4411 family protein [Patescibacteria group bacterium]MDD4695098.1 DUF4411 family protein [Patescibacteria group bacterium]
MINNLTKIKYLVDTNVLIELSLWKPIALNLNKDFWYRLSDALKNDKWVLLDVVVWEVRYDKDLKKWLSEQKNKGLVKKINDNNKNRAVEINNQYKIIDDITGKSTVDTYLLAYAEAENLGIFSRESSRINSNQLYKIPDICNILNINKTRSPKAFLKEIGFN